MSDIQSAPLQSIVALPGDVTAWPTLLDFFAEKFPHVSRETWRTRFQTNQVHYAEFVGAALPRTHGTATEVLNGPSRMHGVSWQKSIPAEALRHLPRAASASDSPRPHTKLTYIRVVENETPIPFQESIIYQDDLILVADKPHFLPVVPSGAYVNETLLMRLKAKTGIATLAPAHRIDRETAGLVLFTIRPDTRGAYQALFRNHAVKKIYEAIAPFRDELTLPMIYRSRLERSRTQFMQAETVFGEANAETLIELIERFRFDRDELHANRTFTSFARYRLTPKTGARHQLRAQLKALGIPIVNDAIYPILKPMSHDDFSKPLQLLAKELAFTDPITRREHRFVSDRSLNLIDKISEA